MAKTNMFEVLDEAAAETAKQRKKIDRETKGGSSDGGKKVLAFSLDEGMKGRLQKAAMQQSLEAGYTISTSALVNKILTEWLDEH